MNINIYFFCWDTYFGNAIRGVTGDDWSHVGIGYKDADGNHQVWEALNEGFVHKEDNYKGDWIEKNEFVNIKTIPCPMSREKFAEIANKYKGNKYDWKAIVFILVTLMAPSMVDRYVYRYKTAKDVICSEVVSRILNDLGVVDLSKKFDKPHDFIRPQEIFNYFSKE